MDEEYQARLAETQLDYPDVMRNERPVLALMKSCGATSPQTAITYNGIWEKLRPYSTTTLRAIVDKFCRWGILFKRRQWPKPVYFITAAGLEVLRRLDERGASG